MRAPTIAPRSAACSVQAALLLAMLALAGCSTLPKSAAPPTAAPLTPAPATKTPGHPEAGIPVLPAAGSGRGGYYQDDGPGDNPPPNLGQLPDAEVRNDPLLPRSNKPYVVFGKTYTPLTGNEPFTQIGVGSWYGKKFHGQRTSSGEIYDMYKMTAAHPTLPIPSYARVTNMDNGSQVIVRINDRGPFHSNRAIDVSYTAALKLGLLSRGSHELKIERILPAEIDRMLAARTNAPTPALALTLSKTMNEPAAAPALAPLPVKTVMEVLPPSASAMPISAPAASSSADIEALMLADRAPADTMPDTPAHMPTATPAAIPANTPANTGATGTASVAVKAGYYLQLGAFSRAENAESVRARVAQTSSKFDTLEVVQGGSVYRLFAGPFATRSAAAQAAQVLPAGLGLKPLIIER